MIKNNWMVSVLGDIAAYAEQSGMSKTYSIVLEAMITASEEMAENQENLLASALLENQERFPVLHH